MTTDALVVDVTLVEINALIAQLEHELARVPASAASAAGAAALVPAASVPAATAEGDTLAATTTKRASWPAKLRQQLAEWTAASPAAAATTGGTASTFSSSLSLLRNSLSSSLSNLRSGSSSASSLYLPPTPPQDAPGAAAVATVQPMPLLRMPTGWVVEVPQTWWTSAVVRVWNENLQPAMMRVAVVLDQARKHVDEVAAKVGVNRGTMGAALAVATLIGVRLVGHRSSSSSTTSRTSASSLVFRFIGSTVGAIARFAVYSTVYSGAYVFFGDKVRQYLSIDPPAADTAPSAASAVVTRPPLSATPDEITVPYLSSLSGLIFYFYFYFYFCNRNSLSCSSASKGKTAV